MKAILEYGRFTSLIEMPTFLHTIHIMKPQEELSFIPLEEFDMTTVENTKLEFRVKERLSEDICVYEFVGES